MKIGNWIKKWKVESSSGNGKYTVSLSDKGVWGCSCPVWKFRREECYHMKQVKLIKPESELSQKPKYNFGKRTKACPK